MSNNRYEQFQNIIACDDFIYGRNMTVVELKERLSTNFERVFDALLPLFDDFEIMPFFASLAFSPADAVISIKREGYETFDVPLAAIFFCDNDENVKIVARAIASYFLNQLTFDWITVIAKKQPALTLVEV